MTLNLQIRAFGRVWYLTLRTGVHDPVRNLFAEMLDSMKAPDDASELYPDPNRGEDT